MVKRPISRSLLIAAVCLVFIALAPIVVLLTRQPTMTSAPQLLTDPFLQLPTETSVRVVWFTEFEGSRHSVAYGQGLTRSAIATTTKLSRTREDQLSKVGEQTQEGQIYKQPTMRDIWRHEAEVTDLSPGDRVPYRVTSVQDNGQSVSSRQFTLAPTPTSQTPLKILLTSDHQLMPMTAANIQKVAQTIGKVDAIFFAGDLVNVPDRASEWFDDNRGGAFFPTLQGRANYKLDKDGVKASYTGGALIQYAPLFTATGNHEVMGRFDKVSNLNEQFNDPYPRAVAEAIYQKNAKEWNTSNNPNLREFWLKNNSFNTDTYNEIFSLPQDNPKGQNYYAVTFGDIRLVVLYITNIWRTPSLDAEARGRFQERQEDLNNPLNWGYGQHIFEPVGQGSAQYNWLAEELNSEAFQQAKYKIVMFHHPPHSLGDNIVPAYTDPVQIVERNPDGTVQAVRYEYPRVADYIIRDVVPRLEASGVQLVFYGHSHVWNRFISPNGTHFLEASNVGNTYGAFTGNKTRSLPTDNKADYAAIGDPNGLEPVMPTLAPLLGEDNQPLPYIASNEVSAFSLLDTGTGTVSSYRFNTLQPESEVVKFDEFRVAQPIKSRKTFSNAVALVAIITLILPILIIAAWLIGIEPKALADSTLPR
ncbi:metallophosphoesterase [Microcoleus sp. FACHB-SPT15]|uniref:metallophosphoesterase n=1 Tax=Microcoleus sp. FACHB-SPT15 TaxID=2692830 RepID=UPI0017801E37|nr:metallophosphoesterase [Microcoleus sp. FACHB-SPT15]MBD1809103.1 metallophosphoesterase [Microcoleus sp. FACHB-SPT15]